MSYSRLARSIAVMLLMINGSFGFTKGRSDVASRIRDTVPTLNTERQTSLYRILSDKIQVSGTDKVLEAIDTKKPGKEAEEAVPREAMRKKRYDTVSETVYRIGDVAELAPALDNFFNENDAPDTPVAFRPRNVIFLLVDEDGQTQDAIWTNFTASHLFPVQETLLNCHNHESDDTWFALDNILTVAVGKRRKECDCMYFLRSTIGRLLLWAQHANEMTTGMLSMINFWTPIVPNYDGPAVGTKEFEELNESIVKPDAHKALQNQHTAWHLTDFNKQSSSSAPEVVAAGRKYDGAGLGWDWLNVFSGLRIDPFIMMLESLDGNMNGTEDEFPQRRRFPEQPNIVELVRSTLRELKSDKNDKGYMLVAVTPAPHLDAVVDLIQNEISRKDTLLVVAGICPRGSQDTAYFAVGPGISALLEARTIWDLPVAVKTSVSGGCHGPHCKDRRPRRHGTLFPLSSYAILTAENAAPLPKRLGRSDERNDKPVRINATDTSGNGTRSENANDSSTAHLQSRNSAPSLMTVDSVATILGTSTMVIANMLISA